MLKPGNAQKYAPCYDNRDLRSVNLRLILPNKTELVRLPL